MFMSHVPSLAPTAVRYRRKRWSMEPCDEKKTYSVFKYGYVAFSVMTPSPACYADGDCGTVRSSSVRLRHVSATCGAVPRLRGSSYKRSLFSRVRVGGAVPHFLNG